MPKAPTRYGKNTFLGVILSGGASRRMGVDKATVQMASLTLWQHVAARLAPQVGELLISISNSQNAKAFAPFACVADAQADSGPLAGMLSVLASPQAQPYEWLVFSSCDTPLQPRDWVAKLQHASAGKPGIYYMQHQAQGHYLHSLWHRSIMAPLHDFLQTGERAVKAFYLQNQAQAISYSAPEDPFMNINTPADLARLTHV
jgi:molybdenum cofactor guanylyltransferase